MRAEARRVGGDVRVVILMPKLQAGIPGGFTVPPHEIVFPVPNLQQAA
jgi:hypothetical protein